jgi:hypothetical protein
MHMSVLWLVTRHSMLIWYPQVTFQAQPVVLDDGFGSTIITINETFRVFEFSGHWLALDRAIQISKCRLHVRYSLAADWTAE